MSGIIDSNNYTYTATADLFCTNLDPSGMYTLSFTDEVQRDNHFTSGNIGTKIALGSDFTYIRKDGVLKVNLNADYIDSMGINYCRFKNSNLNQSARFIYCFIDSVEYIAPTVSALHIRTDSFMTYQFDILTGSGHQEFIERRTVNASEDIIYKNLLEEPVNCTNYELDRRISARETISTKSEFVNKYDIGIIFKPMVVGTHDGAFLDLALNEDANKTEKDMINQVCGHYMNGLPSGGNILVVKDFDHFDQVNQMISFLGSEIIATFWIPKSSAVQLDSRHIVYTVENINTTEYRECYFYTPRDDTWTISGYPITGTMTNAFDSYDPINKKCFNYPYNYMIGTDNCGSEIPYRFEHFYNVVPDTGAVTFSASFITNTSNAIVLKPNNYMSTNECLDHAIIVEGFPQIPYSTNEFNYYLGTHSAAVSNAKIQTALDYGKSAITFLNNTYGSGNTDLLSIASEAVKGVLSNYQSNYTNLMTQTDTEKQLGYSTHNGGSITTRATLGYLGASVFHKYLCDHDIALVDMYFSRYGYNWSRIEDFSFNHCPDYDYVKTSGCNIEGSIPVADKQNLSKLFDSGITIWHYKNGASRYGLFADQQHPNK